MSVTRQTPHVKHTTRLLAGNALEGRKLDGARVLHACKNLRSGAGRRKGGGGGAFFVNEFVAVKSLCNRSEAGRGRERRGEEVQGNLVEGVQLVV